MKYPNIVYTALLSAFLLVPFALRFGLTEPYPAVLLPSGAGTIKVAGDRIDTNIAVIYGRIVGHDGWFRLSPSRLLHPIPIEFFPPLAARYFGMSPIPHRTFKIGPIKIDTQQNISEGDIKNAKQWFRARLTGGGYDENVLRVTQEVVTFRRSDGAQLAVRYQDDKILDLR